MSSDWIRNQFIKERALNRNLTLRGPSLYFIKEYPTNKGEIQMDNKKDHDPSKSEQSKQDQKPHAFPSDTMPKSLDPSKPIDATHHPTSTAQAARDMPSQPKVGEEKKDKLGQETDKLADKTEEYTGPGSTNRSLGNTAQPFTKENLKEMDEKAGNVSDTTEDKSQANTFKEAFDRKDKK